MIRIAGKNKILQYSIGGVLAVVILFGWFSIPLVSNSSLDSAVPYGNPFKSRSINLYSLGGEIPLESGAPGSPLSGEMINNPVTSGEEISSSLLHTTGEGIIWGEKEESGGPSENKKGDASSDYSANIGSGGMSAPGKKLSPMPSLSSGGGGTMTSSGKSHDKFFGKGTPSANLVPANLDTDKGKDKSLKVSYGGSGGNALSSLKTAGARSLMASSSRDADLQRGGAASAFGSSKKPERESLSTNLENVSSAAGLELGQVANDLKANDPTLNKKIIRPPAPKPAGLTEEDKEKQFQQQMKMMFLQMLLQCALGAVFGTAVGK